jgi:hypothetical protein
MLSKIKIYVSFLIDRSVIFLYDKYIPDVSGYISGVSYTSFSGTSQYLQTKSDREVKAWNR